MEITGNLAGRPWRVELGLETARHSVGIAALWGRSKIEAVSDQLRRGADPDSVRAKIVEIALKHHLLSEHTSLIAVDPMPARPAEARLVSQLTPARAPAPSGRSAVASAGESSTSTGRSRSDACAGSPTRGDASASRLDRLFRVALAA